ncbi:MAG: ribonuclease III [Firmicutes bacterium]|nr:ribonuclease III [Bacillota bacterium]MBQ2677318.1 ribonuclease III [Bacillota bacterium]
MKDILKINTTALAFMGDAAYETAVREHLLKKGKQRPDVLHREAVRYVSAPAQAAVIKEMLDELTDDEKALVKRARNRKSISKPKNADPVDYKWATAFESLAGYLWLSGDRERFDWLCERAIEIVEG